jgi:hypothetical protein
MIHHIGIIVKEFESYINLFTSMGGVVLDKYIVEEFEAECLFIDMGNVYIELIKSTVNNNHLNRFIDKYGEGLHHIAVSGNGKTKGALPNMYVSFNKPDETNRILIESVEFK